MRRAGCELISHRAAGLTLDGPCRSDRWRGNRGCLSVDTPPWPCSTHAPDSGKLRVSLEEFGLFFLVGLFGRRSRRRLGGAGRS
jgi:hypothetical protein